MANRGKKICKTLKEIRQKVAEENDIPLKKHECTYEGDCNGTCPYCDAELRYIEGELEKRKAEKDVCFVSEKQLLCEQSPIEEDDDTTAGCWLYFT